MADFIYEKPFQIERDLTTYRLLTKDYVKVTEEGGRKILKVDPKGLELLAKEAVSDLSFYLRTAHLEKLAMILDDPEATDNDRFVAYMMLRNTVISSKEDLPWCQDTGTAIVIGKKGEDVFTGGKDAVHLSKGIYETFKNKNLRYSQIVHNV
jgi:fumarate hydratase class I